MAPPTPIKSNATPNKSTSTPNKSTSTPNKATPTPLKFSIAQRAQAMALLEYGAPIADIMRLSGLKSSTIYDLRKRMRQRGYDPKVNPVFKDEYFKNGARSGRPRKDKSNVPSSKIEDGQHETDVNSERDMGTAGILVPTTDAPMMPTEQSGPPQPPAPMAGMDIGKLAYPTELSMTAQGWQPYGIASTFRESPTLTARSNGDNSHLANMFMRMPPIGLPNPNQNLENGGHGTNT